MSALGMPTITHPHIPRVDIHIYVREHNVPPRGRGCWCFRVWERLWDGSMDGHDYWYPEPGDLCQSMLYTQARARLLNRVKTLGIQGHDVRRIEVMP